jgi:IS30 family transposase
MSSEQIVGRARREEILLVSHERICQFIREDKKKGDTLYNHLRHRLKPKATCWREEGSHTG